MESKYNQAADLNEKTIKLREESLKLMDAIRNMERRAQEAERESMKAKIYAIEVATRTELNDLHSSTALPIEHRPAVFIHPPTYDESPPAITRRRYSVRRGFIGPRSTDPPTDVHQA